MLCFPLFGCCEIVGKEKEMIFFFFCFLDLDNFVFVLFFFNLFDCWEIVGKEKVTNLGLGIDPI